MSLVAVLQHISPDRIRKSSALRFAAGLPIFTAMTTSPTNTPQTGHYPASETPVIRPVQLGRVNWDGLWPLYLRAVHRFAAVGMQTVAAPVITSMLLLMVFAVAVGDRANLAGAVTFIHFLWPRL